MLWSSVCLKAILHSECSSSADSVCVLHESVTVDSHLYAPCHTGFPDLSRWRSMQHSVCESRGVDRVAAGTSGEHLPNIGCESASSLSASRAKNSRCRNASALQQIDSYCIHRIRPELVNATAAHFRRTCESLHAKTLLELSTVWY